MSSTILLELHVVFDQYFMNKILEFWNSVTQRQFLPKYLPHIGLLTFSDRPIEQIDAIVRSVLLTQKPFDVAFFPWQISHFLCLGIQNATLLEELQLRLLQYFPVNDGNTVKIVPCWPLVAVTEMKQIHYQQLRELPCSSMVVALRLVRVVPQSTDLRELKIYRLASDEHEPFRIAQEIPLLPVSSTSKGCCCKKSKCLKLYCSCFNKGSYCTPGICSCLGCQNRIAQEIPLLPVFSTSKGCCCKQSKCLKLYCSCFNKGSYCTPGICSCLGCQNSIEHIEINKARIQSRHIFSENDEQTHPLNLGKGCICLKSKCSNMYCQCFKNKLRCSSECRCKGCKNGN